MEDNKIYFPRNVQKHYQLTEGLGWPEIKRYIIPAILVITGIAVLPPYSSVLFWIVKFVMLILIIPVVITLVFIKPVPTRRNISFEQWLKDNKRYNKRQKVFFIEKKDKKIHGK